MTNKKVEINKEEVEENRFTKHFKKHKSAYATAAVAGVSMVGMKLSENRRLAEAIRFGMKIEAEMTWTNLTKHVKAGKLSIEQLGEIDGEALKHNIATLKELVKSEEV